MWTPPNMEFKLRPGETIETLYTKVLIKSEGDLPGLTFNDDRAIFNGSLIYNTWDFCLSSNLALSKNVHQVIAKTISRSILRFLEINGEFNFSKKCEYFRSYFNNLGLIYGAPHRRGSGTATFYVAI